MKDSYRKPLSHVELTVFATKARHLTTGQVGRILGCSQQKVIRVFDAGLLKGFVIPGSRDRHIPVENVVEFARKQGIEIPPLTPVTLEPEHDPQAESEITRYRGSFELGTLMIGQPVTKIILSEGLLGNLDSARRNIQKTCEKHDYPVPEMVDEEQTHSHK